MPSKWDVERTWNRTDHDTVVLRIEILTQNTTTAYELFRLLEEFMRDRTLDLEASDCCEMSLTHTVSAADISRDYPENTEIASVSVNKVGIPIEKFTAEAHSIAISERREAEREAVEWTSKENSDGNH